MRAKVATKSSRSHSDLARTLMMLLLLPQWWHLLAQFVFGLACLGELVHNMTSWVWCSMSLDLGSMPSVIFVLARLSLYVYRLHRGVNKMQRTKIRASSACIEQRPPPA